MGLCWMLAVVALLAGHMLNWPFADRGGTLEKALNAASNLCNRNIDSNLKKTKILNKSQILYL